MEYAQRRIEEEKARIEAEYRQVLKNSVASEKKIRNRWREKNRQKSIRIAELEARVGVRVQATGRGELRMIGRRLQSLLCDKNQTAVLLDEPSSIDYSVY